MSSSWQDWLAREDEARRSAGLHRPRKVNVEGLLSFSDNDYLALSSHPAVKAAAIAALRDGGMGTRASALVEGRTQSHAELEEALAAAKDAQSALLFPSGYAANLSLLAALADDETTIYSDALNHASIVDGCRLAGLRGARIEVFRHRDLDDLEERLRRSGSRRRIVVVESVFSMDGDLFDLEGLVALKRRHDFFLIVDEAHATGVLGPGASGLAGRLQVGGDVDAHLGTLSKALGSLGGFVAGSSALIDQVWHRGRSQVFSTALPLPVVAAARAALALVETEECGRHELDARRAQMSRALGQDFESAICPLVLGEPEAAVRASESLRAVGILVPAIRPPTVPEGSSRLRISLSARHEAEDVERLLKALDGL